MGKKRIIKKPEGSDADGIGKNPVVVGAARVSRIVARGIVHIRATYNNTLVTVTDDRGGVLAWSSAGALGFSGAKKATPFAAARTIESLAEKLRKAGLQDVVVRVSGVGSGRDSAIRALINQGFTISSIKDITPQPHNGPRPKKVRRV